MSAKASIIEAFTSDLPEALQGHLETVIPTLTATTAPTDEASAIITQGILAHNLNMIFKAFEGLPLVAIPLYIGQLNTVNQGLLLSALEFVGAKGEMVVIAPANGGIYYGYFLKFKAELIRGGLETLTGSEGEDSFEFEEVEEKLYSAEWIMGVGSHTVVVQGTFSDGTTTKDTVSFEVKDYSDVPTFPQDDETLTAPLDEIQFLTGISTDDIDEEVTVSIDGAAPVSMVKVAFLGFSATASVANDGQMHSLTFYMGGNETKNIVFHMSGV